MAQPKVTEFFTSRKRNADFQPSKRRKVIRTTDIQTDVINESRSITSQTKSVRGRSRNPRAVNLETKGKVTATSASKQRRATSLRKQCTPSVTSIATLEQSTSVEKTCLNVGKTPDVVGEASECCDDHHSSPPSTPTKRTSTAADKTGTTTTNKRSRNVRSIRKDLLKELEKTPEQFDFSKYAESSPSKSVRRKLMVRRSLSSERSVAKSKVPESLSPKQVWRL